MYVYIHISLSPKYIFCGDKTTFLFSIFRIYSRKKKKRMKYCQIENAIKILSLPFTLENIVFMTHHHELSTRWRSMLNSNKPFVQNEKNLEKIKLMIGVRQSFIWPGQRQKMGNVKVFKNARRLLREKWTQLWQCLLHILWVAIMPLISGLVPIIFMNAISENALELKCFHKNTLIYSYSYA